jgi:general secretion pathway protein D
MKMIKITGMCLAILLLLTSCTAGRRAFDDGHEMIQSGQVETGLAALEQALKENKDSIEYRSYYLRQKELYIAQLLVRGDSARVAQQYEEADGAFRRVLKYEPNNQHALDGIDAAHRDKRHDEMAANADKLIQAGKMDEAQTIARTILAEDPRHAAALRVINVVEEKEALQNLAGPTLGAAFKKPISLEFRDANLKAIFEVISRATQINFIFDRDVRPDLKSTIFVKNTTIEDVINLLMVTNQLDKRVLNDNTVLIYPNTPAKAKDYQEMVVHAFYLSNADVKQTLNMIKTLVKTRDVFIDEKLNLLVMKDTPEAIRLAEKLIATQDRAEPEVMLEVEVLEVKRSRLLSLGIQYPNTFTALNIANQQTQSNVSGGAVVTTSAQTQNIVTVDTLRHLTSRSIAVSPNLQLNLQKDDGDVQILANPRIRVKNREKAKIHIGDKVPVITTTSTANVGISETVNYLDIGLKLDVEPQVYLDDEVGIKVGLEVSNIVREIRSQSGSLTYQIGTRNAATVLRLKDGETQVLAGLISDEDRRSASKIPGLGDLPLLGHLFSTHSDNATKTEIILLITPRIVRNITRLDARLSEFASGTDASIGASPLTLRQSKSSAQPITLQGQGTPNPVTPASAAATPPSVIAPVPLSLPPVPTQRQDTSPPLIATAPGASSLALSLVTVPAIARGQEFNLLVQAAVNVDVKSLAFDFVYDPQTIEIVRVVEGAFLKQGDVSTSFAGAPKEGSNRFGINIARSVGGARGSGAVLVVVLKSKADAVGATPLTIENVNATGVTGAALSMTPPAPVSVIITP